MSWDDDTTFSSVSVMSLSSRIDTRSFLNIRGVGAVFFFFFLPLPDLYRTLRTKRFDTRVCHQKFTILCSLCGPSEQVCV